MPLSNDGMGDTTSVAPPQKYYINRETVARVEDHSGEHADWMNQDWDAPDLRVELFYDIGKDDWMPSIEVMGSFETDREGRITGWGKAFLVGELFDKLGISFELNEDGTMPRYVFEEAPGTDFFMLRYVAGEKSDGSLEYYTYNRIEKTPERSDDFADEEDAKDALEDQFLYGVQEGYVDNYMPSILDDEDEGGGQPTAQQPAGSASNGSSEQDTFEPDDDLPF